MTPDENDGQSASTPRAVVEITLDNPADSGAAVGRDADGRAVFCDGGLQGETVRVELVTQKKRFARGRVIEVLNPSPDRIEARCSTHRAGCGGCDLAHASADSQLAMKQHVVRDALQRIGRLDPAAIDESFVMRPDALEIPERYRTTVRAAITDGQAGYRQRGSHDGVWASQCLVVHERLEELLIDGRFGASAGAEVVLRVSDSTGQRIALVDGSTAEVQLPDDVVVVSRSDTAARAALHVIEHAGGRDWRVSADSFFQAGPQVASALVDAVQFATGNVEDLSLIDAYSGIGLFAGTVGADAASVTAVERSGSSTADATINLADGNVTIVESAVEHWKAEHADIVIADPARSGLGKAGVDSLLRAKPQRFVLVACDTGSLGRDVGLLSERGYSLESIQIVDAFHDTSHVETIVGLRG